MSVELAELIVLAMGLYFAGGLVVGLIYIFGGAGRIDPAAKGKGLPWRVRLLLLPGLSLLWPIMLVKLFTQKAPPLR